MSASSSPASLSKDDSASDTTLINNYFKNFDNAGMIIMWILGVSSLILVIMLISTLVSMGTS